MDKDLNMTDERWVAALKRLRERIAGGAKLVYFDDTTIGCKETQCTWGLCCNSKEQWPDPEDHLWPDQFEKNGRVAPKYRKAHHRCPFDMREKDEKWGCFYHCVFFQKGENPSRDEALKAIDALLKEVSCG
jgi:hypothetical protein